MLRPSRRAVYSGQRPSHKRIAHLYSRRCDSVARTLRDRHGVVPARLFPCREPIPPPAGKNATAKRTPQFPACPLVRQGDHVQNSGTSGARLRCRPSRNIHRHRRKNYHRNDKTRRRLLPVMRHAYIHVRQRHNDCLDSGGAYTARQDTIDICRRLRNTSTGYANHTPKPNCPEIQKQAEQSRSRSSLPKLDKHLQVTPNHHALSYSVNHFPKPKYETCKTWLWKNRYRLLNTTNTADGKRTPDLSTLPPNLHRYIKTDYSTIAVPQLQTPRQVRHIYTRHLERGKYDNPDIGHHIRQLPCKTQRRFSIY